jgi:hypothetical protein
MERRCYVKMSLKRIWCGEMVREERVASVEGQRRR